MGRQNEDHRSVIGSSIVLLQERFKQLQRMKEMREERQLLQLLPQSTYAANEYAGFRDPLALGLNSNTNYNALFTQNHQKMLIQQQQQQQQQQFQFPSAAHVMGPYNFFDKADVDTSLHL